MIGEITASNDDIMNLTPTHRILIGTMLPGFVTISEGLNLTLKASVLTHGSSAPIMAYIKPELDSRKMFVEFICAMLGRDLGLPIPKPILVNITSESWDKVEAGCDKISFASEAIDYPNFRRFGIDAKSILKLQKFNKSFEVGIFDEWIANYDRNSGNILFDGSDDFYFIDHELSLSSCYMPDSHIHANEIIRCVFEPGEDHFKKLLLAKLSQDIIPIYANLAIKSLPEYLYFDKHIQNSEIATIIDFLENRINHLFSCIEHKLNIKQQELI